MNDDTYIRQNILDDIETERSRQITLWGIQDHSPERWLAILGEEFGEVSKEVAEGIYKEFNWERFRTELIQTAAVSAAAVETIDRLGLIDGA